MASINVDKGNPEYSSVDGVLFDKARKTLLQYPNAKHGAYAIPDGVAEIKQEAFELCRGLTSVTIPGSVAVIRRYEFLDCDNLASVTVAADNARYLSEDGVLFDKNKTVLMKYPAGKQGDSYTIPGSVVSIDPEAFAGCDALISLTVGEGVASIGEGAFAECGGLRQIIVRNPKPPKLGRDAVEDIDWDGACLYVPASGIDAYRRADWWKKFECVKDLASGVPAIMPAVSQPDVSSNPDSIAMVYVAGGAFLMGCTAEQGNNCSKNEKPARKVTVGGFYIAKYETTQGLWMSVTDSNPSWFTRDDRLPVENVYWDDVQEFIQKLNAKTGKKYRLPTEEEWEYAARGGNKSRGYRYSGGNNIGDVAWYYSNSNGKTKTHIVGTKQANELDIHDMTGNVSEWTNSEIETDEGSRHVVRGGGWNDGTMDSRVSSRGAYSSFAPRSALGFRLARDP
jgi:formylglycine-generating enzyme required for sulfatase activity